MEYKFTPLAQLKMVDKGSGEISGHRAVFGVVDEGGDVITPGAFADCLDRFLNCGFTANSHDWNFSAAVGYPVESREDHIGWFVRSQFHSTQAAQDVRTIVKERMKAGKQVGFSFGYAVIESEQIESSEYRAKLPLYLKSEYLSDGLVKAQRFSRIRVLKKLDAVEDSIVTVPMNRLAGVTDVKSRSHLVSSNRYLSLRAQNERIRAQLIEALIS